MRCQLPILLLASLLAGCGSGRSVGAIIAPQPRLVSVLVEVYNPVTNFVWEDVSVRIVASDQEWSGCTCVSPYTEWFFTDSTGRVLFDEYLIAGAEVGFLEDSTGAAVLAPESHEDEATLVLEIGAVGFAPVIVEVSISWADPDVFVEVPFF